MRSKKLLASFIVALTLVSTGCGNSTSDSSKVSITPKDLQGTVKTEPARFSAEKADISGEDIDSSIKNSWIFTDHKTGKQYLYIDGYGHRVTMVEIGTIDDINTDTTK